MLARSKSRVGATLTTLLREGVTPERVALSLAMGLAAGIFPVIGATTILALVVGGAFGLNHVAVQVANWLAYPLQLLLIVPLVSLGRWVLGTAPGSLGLTEVVTRVGTDPSRALAAFGTAGLHAVVGWLIVVPFLVPVVYRLLLPLIHHVGRRLSRSGGLVLEGEERAWEAS